MLGDRIDLNQPTFAIINEFDLGSHVARMAEGHPTWSQRQLECCLYWQPKARAQLKMLCQGFLREHPNYVVDSIPEAGGMNVTETLWLVGIELEWPPRKIVRQIAVAGLKRF
jgi:hypothetical protein